MLHYKNIEYEVEKDVGEWKWIALAGAHTRSGVAGSKALATRQVLNAIDMIVKQKRLAAMLTNS